MATRHKRLDTTFGGVVNTELLRSLFNVFYPQYPGPRRWFEIVAWYRLENGVEQARAVACELKKVLCLARGEAQVSEALRDYGCAYVPSGNVRHWLIRLERKLKRRASPNNSFKPNTLRGVKCLLTLR